MKDLTFDKILRGFSLEDLQQNNAKDQKRHKDIHNAMASILKSYERHPREDIDFSQEVMREAYCIMYGTSHINMVHSIFYEIRSHTFDYWLQSLGEKGECRICCIGGGPGSDLIGFISYLRYNKNSTCKITASIFDLYPVWEKTFNKLKPTFGELLTRNVEIVYGKFDFLKEMDNKLRETLLDADIVLFVKSMSAFPMDNKYSDRIMNLVELLKPGSLLLFIDNASGPHGRIICEVADKCGAHPIISSKAFKTALIPQERSAMRKFLQVGKYPDKKSHAQTNLISSVFMALSHRDDDFCKCKEIPDLQSDQNNNDDNQQYSYHNDPVFVVVDEYNDSGYFEGSSDNSEGYPSGNYNDHLALCKPLVMNNPIRGNFFSDSNSKNDVQNTPYSANGRYILGNNTWYANIQSPWVAGSPHQPNPYFQQTSPYSQSQYQTYDKMGPQWQSNYGYEPNEQYNLNWSYGDDQYRGPVRNERSRYHY